MKEIVRFIEGDTSIDDRGELLFCNDFDMKDVRRFYQVSNYNPQFIRAWHAHKGEAKYVTVTSGSALVAAVKIDNWDCPDKNAEVFRFVLGEKRPGVLLIPEGYANGFMTLLPDTKALFFSTKTLKESKDDDYRFDPFYWNPWEIVPR